VRRNCGTVDGERAPAQGVQYDDVVVCGTFGALELAAFAFDRGRTEAWTIAPHTDVRVTLGFVDAIANLRALK
jgi:hypothetical protein